jgi:hypothetical protein
VGVRQINRTSFTTYHPKVDTGAKTELESECRREALRGRGGDYNIVAKIGQLVGTLRSSVSDA